MPTEGKVDPTQRTQIPKDIQLEMLCTHHLMLGKPLSQCAREMNLSANVLYKLASSDEFASRKEEFKKRLGEPAKAFVESMEADLKKLVPLVMTRFRDILESSLDEKVVSRVGDSVLDRTGFARQQRVEGHHILELSPESLGLLARAEKEHDAIELSRSDWSYAHERPTDTRTRLLSQRSAETAPEGEGSQVNLLHGQGSDRVQGPRPGRPRNDGPVDSERGEEKARFSPAGSFEDVGMDNR